MAERATQTSLGRWLRCFNLVIAACALLPVFLPVAAVADEAAEQRNLARRAVDAAIWGLPAVNTDLMLQEMLTKTSAKVNQVVYWGRPLDYRNQTLTPNPDVIYFMTFFDTRDVGPIVLDPAGR
ncbi:DUF1254 domain-containing protein [Rhizobium laguerreae]|uniref:DUF1254 domain-containing protein n=1 Tax=Rhizobium laguerreae TaxID=1076926 RepID=UPI001FE8A104|nr:DUF1254 domain-containing protein [Rhizobium laguerreae]MBY3232695.1 DUF1254 domain-containing protein [Rhizobium laguerreae]